VQYLNQVSLQLQCIISSCFSL